MAVFGAQDDPAHHLLVDAIEVRHQDQRHGVEIGVEGPGDGGRDFVGLDDLITETRVHRAVTGGGHEDLEQVAGRVLGPKAEPSRGLTRGVVALPDPKRLAQHGQRSRQQQRVRGDAVSLGALAEQNQGRAFRRLIAAMQESVKRHESVDGLEELTTALSAAIGRVTETTMKLGGAAMGGKIRLFLSNATEYLHMLGHVVIAWMWLEQAGTAAAQLGEAGEDDRPFFEGKIHKARFFTRYELPRIERQAALLQRLDDTTLTMPNASF